MLENHASFLTCREVAGILRLTDNQCEDVEEQIVHLVENHGLPHYELPLRNAPRFQQFLFEREDVINWLVHRQVFQGVEDATELSSLEAYHGLSVRSQNVLHENQIQTVEELRKISPRVMVDWRNCGGKTLAELTAFRSFVVRMAAGKCSKEDNLVSQDDDGVELPVDVGKNS